MSIIATVSISEGLIMASDSRITGSYIVDTPSGKQIDRYTISDNGQKIFMIVKKIGISVCGDMIIDNLPITEFIRNFENECCNTTMSVEECAKNLSAYTRLKGKQANVVYHVSGYDGGNQKIFRVKGDTIEPVERYSACWDGEAAVLNNLLTGSFPLNLNLNFMYLKDGIEFAEFLIDVTCQTQRFSNGVATCGGPIDILLITKDETRWIKHKILNP